MSIRVLVADDQEIVRTGLTMILDAQAGIEVVAQAADGNEAIALARTARPDVCLVDIRMPGLDGLSVLQSMRSERPDTFVAMISGGGSLDNVRSALDRGASGFVIKPYKPQRILDLLSKYHKQSGHNLTA